MTTKVRPLPLNVAPGVAIPGGAAHKGGRPVAGRRVTRPPMRSDAGCPEPVRPRDARTGRSVPTTSSLTRPKNYCG
jgi:hypothetical protein